MQILRLVAPESLFVGIVEFINEKNLNKDELLSIATSNVCPAKAIQFFNSELIVDASHLLVATQNAVNAWYGNYQQSRSLEIEIAIYASGQNQIGRALDLLGVKDGMARIAAVVLCSDEDTVNECIVALRQLIGKVPAEMFPPIQNKFDAIMKAFDVSEEEIRVFTNKTTLESIQAALAKCIASRVSSVALMA